MKYIKLFEAFKSYKLAKTLKFIDSESRDTFLTNIKSLCNRTEYPLSEIDDSFFTYLPFRKAVQFHKEADNKPCTQTSEDQFNYNAAIPGEKCQGGRIKRKWGTDKVRYIECTRCNGTGIEPFSPRWKYLKFWFNIDGRLVGTTATDGRVQGTDGDPFRFDNIVEVSYGEISKFWNYDIERIQNYTKDANFALILDLDKIHVTGTDVIRRNITKDNRRTSKANALALRTDYDIKKVNIARYFDMLVKRSKVKGNIKDISNIRNVIMRILCNSKILFTLNSSGTSNCMNKVDNVIDELYETMVSIQKNNGKSFDTEVDNINYYIVSYLNDVREYKTTIQDSLRETESFVKRRAEKEKDLKPLKLFNNIMEINNIIFKYFTNYKVDTLEDLEEFHADLTTVYELINQRRYGLRTLSSFFTKTTSSWSSYNAKNYLTSDGLSNKEVDYAIEGSDRFIKFLKNRYSI